MKLMKINKVLIAGCKGSCQKHKQTNIREAKNFLKMQKCKKNAKKRKKCYKSKKGKNI